MGDMPSRPRQHEIETESRRRFASMLPSSWVARDIHEDYGIDLEVEIFEAGKATGLIFRVQLKATDKAPKRGGISRGDIKRQTLNYWKSLDAPVLVVAYSTRAQTFHARWADSYDSYYARNPDAKTITINFAAHHIFNDAAIEKLPWQVGFIRAVRRRELGFPMPVHFLPSRGIQGHSDQRIRAKLAQAVRATDGILELSADESRSTVLIIGDETIRASLPTEIRTATVHVEADDYVDPPGFEAIIADAIVCIAHLFISAGEFRAAGNLLKRFGPSARALCTLRLLDSFVREFLTATYIPDAFDLIKKLIDDDRAERREYAELILTVIFKYPGPRGLNDAEFQEMIERVQHRSEIERGEGRSAKAGRTLYNIAEMFRAKGGGGRALDAFDKALANDPTYGNRGYYWRARGSILYELECYGEAADDYRKAVECGDSPEAAFLLSDVLMRLGRYADAYATPVRADATDYYALGERMNRRVLAAITGIVSTQTRCTPPDEVLQALADSPTVENAEQAIRDYDALDPRLWYALGKAMWAADEVPFAAYVVIADLKRDNAVFWAHSAALAVAIGAPEQDVDDLCDSGLKWCESDLLDTVERLCQDDGPAFTEQVRDKVYERAQLERPRWPRVVRLVNEAGEYMTLKVP